MNTRYDLFQSYARDRFRDCSLYRNLTEIGKDAVQLKVYDDWRVVVTTWDDGDAIPADLIEAIAMVHLLRSGS